MNPVRLKIGNKVTRHAGRTRAMTGGAPQPPSFAPEVHKGDIPKEYRLQRYYTAADIAGHNTAHNCWVSFFGRVYDLTPLLAEYKGPLAQPIIAAAGSDISFWFDEATGQPKMHLDPVTGMQEIYCPWGRYIHVPPQGPESDWATDFGTPWWEDTRYWIGLRSAATRKIGIVNLMTRQKNTLEVPVEETVAEIQQRYLVHNAHAGSYTWKRLGKPLNMDKTLAENGMEDETEEFLRLSIDPDHIPVIHLHFNDDLTEA